MSGLLSGDFTGLKPAWCPGCGNFGILSALNQAFIELDLAPDKILMVSGIGQAGKLPHYTRCNLFNGLHGRAIPAAIGAKLVSPALTVIASGGDGDGYGEGGNHWLHAIRRNHDITYLVHNNQVYGLTKGQTSPTSDRGFVTKSTPEGATTPLNPMAVAIAAGGTFVARAFAGDIHHLTGIIKEAVRHHGFSMVDILQPCVSFNHLNTFEWYRRRVYRLDLEQRYDRGDKLAAFARAQEWGERIPIGVLYQSVSPVYEDGMAALSMDETLTGLASRYSAVSELIEDFT
jgi:2-oxoglutarate ferredoxin oxidoreductase subunit beta